MDASPPPPQAPPAGGASAAPALAATDLVKRYGARTVVQGVSLAVAPGEVYALVGPNGAGKTTVIRLLSGLAFATSGTVTMLGTDPQREPGVRRRLGAVVEAPAAFYPWWTGRTNLRLHARLAGGVPAGRIDALLALVELEADADRRVATYSLGMRQRLGVAAALLAAPDVLILDEPASGMDPLSLHVVHRALRDAAAEGAAVVLSTHHLDEVARYGSRAGILEEGALIDEVDLVARRGRYRAVVGDADAAVAALAGVGLEAVRDARHDPRGEGVRWRVAQPEGGDEAAVAARATAALVAAGCAVVEVREDVFDLRAYYRDRIHERRGVGVA